MSIMVLLTMLKYELINNLMTSVSTLSLSESVPEAFRIGGGASIAAIRFLFLEAKKLPKNPEFSALVSRDWLVCWGCKANGTGFPVFGST